MNTGPAAAGWRPAPALLLLLLYAGYMAAIGAASWRQPLAVDGAKLYGVRYIADNFDRLSYLYRGQWAAGGSSPASNHYGDYPFLMTLYFGIPFKLTARPALLVNFFPAANFLWFALLLALTAPLAARPRAWLWFWALPTTAWFVGNRFDIIPVTFTAGALVLLQRRRLLASALLLALALGSKWYPLALFLPLFGYLRAQGVTLRVIAGYLLLPLLVAAGLQGLALPFAGGAAVSPAILAGRIVPHLFGDIAAAEPGSLGSATAAVLPALAPWLPLLPLVCWGLAAALPLLRPPRSFTALLAQGAACLILLVAGAQMYSPQWFLWFGSLAALGLAARRDALLLAVISLATYIRFPVLYDLTGTGAAYAGWSLFVWGLIFLLLARLLRRPPGPA